eukprot:1435523-Amphidinium_carterae.1
MMHPLPAVGIKHFRESGLSHEAGPFACCGPIGQQDSMSLCGIGMQTSATTSDGKALDGCAFLLSRASQPHGG